MTSDPSDVLTMGLSGTADAEVIPGPGSQAEADEKKETS